MLVGDALIVNPALAKAVVIGLFGGAGLGLTAIYSRRGPMIYPVYAAIVVALTLLLVRYPFISFGTRFTASMAGFAAASAVLYVVVGVLASRERHRSVAEGKLLETALKRPISVWGHAWRIGFLLAIGSVVSAAAAFVAG